MSDPRTFAGNIMGVVDRENVDPSPLGLMASEILEKALDHGPAVAAGTE